MKAAIPYRLDFGNRQAVAPVFSADVSDQQQSDTWIGHHFSDRPYRSLYGIPVSHMQVFWTPVSVVLNALILLTLVDTIHPKPIDWHSYYQTAFNYVRTVEDWLLLPLVQMIESTTGHHVPDWGEHLIFGYAVAGSAFALEGGSFKSTSTIGRMGMSMVTAASWPLALSYFVIDMLRQGTVLHFIKEHSRFYRLYNTAILVVFAGGILVNALLLNV